ncbi:unnamed protein product [Rhizophagus irregularis]|nr:unnamed protein product [Rhizophagus irregularis]
MLLTGLKQDMYGNCHGSFPSRYSGTYSFEKKRLKFPDDPRGIRLCNYLNFTLFTFNKIRILIQYLVAKIGMIGLRLGCR